MRRSMSNVKTYIRKKRKQIIVAIVIILVTIYYLMWPPSYMNDAPRRSCTEMPSRENSDWTQSPGAIMIGIHLTNRSGYTNFTASVIKNYQRISDKDIWIFSASERLYYSEQTLRTWYGQHIHIVDNTNGTGHLRVLLDVFISSDYKLLFLIDSEMVFLRDWEEFMTRHMMRNGRQFVSLYHSAAMHDFAKDCAKQVDGLCVGGIFEKGGVALRKDFVKRVLSRHARLIDGDGWNEILAKEKVVGYYPAKSIIMKIGQRNQNDNHCGDNDVPYGFRLCELPCWIRDGIEFYFDLCTSPQEIYSPELSIIQAHAEKRMWTRPAVVYSFYGNNPRYVNGAIENAKRLFTIYPGWKIWIYLDNSVTSDVARELCSYSVRFLNMTGTGIRNRMSWRFLIASEPVKYFTILDIDYRMLSRGKAATDEWLKSGRKFHVMRDHPQHSIHAINGQMWGGYGKSIPNMKELIVDYSAGDWFMMDIHFLTAKVWPIVKQSVWVHDSHSLHKFGEDHPFPTKRKGDKFVGNVDFS